MLSVLIVNWNTKDLLLACLNSLFKHPPEEEMEVIVVDNASADGSKEAVEKWMADIDELRLTIDDSAIRQYRSIAKPQFNLIKSAINSGYAHGNNLAFEVAKGQWLLTLNPDTEVLEGTLQKAIDTLKRRPKDAVLGARLISPDGSIQRSVRGFPTLLGIFGNLTGFDKVLPNGPFGSYSLPKFDYETEQAAEQPMGTFLLFRREALENSKHPFDESFPIFFNEVDLLKRLSNKGGGCVYDPAVRVLHHGGESTKQVRPKMIWESHRSLIRYLKKHTLRWWNAPLLGLVGIVVWIGALVRARRYDVGFRP